MDPYQYWPPEYFTYDPGFFKGQIQNVLGIINSDNQLRALDIGTGLGKGILSLENAGFETFGIEPSEAFRTAAISKMGVEPDKIIHSTIEEIELTQQFDFINFGAVFEHLSDPFKALQKSVSWLKPRGVIHIEVPNSQWLISKMVNLGYRITGSNLVTNLSPMHPPYHLYEFHLKSFQEACLRLNLEITRFDYYVCSVYHIPRIFHPILISYMKKSNTGMQLAVYLQKN